MLRIIYGLMLLANTQATIQLLKQESGSVDQTSSNWDDDCGQWIYDHSELKYKIKNCRTTVDIKSCYLQTEYWKIPNDVNSVHVHIEGDGNNCTTCSVNYVLDASLEGGKGQISKKVTQNVPTKIKPLQKTFYVYNETIPIHVTSFTKMRIKFIPKNFCGGINRVRLYYYNCPVTSKELVEFYPKPAPYGSEPLTIYGKCTHNGLPDSNPGFPMPSMKCYSNGTATVQGKCICMEGYQPKDNKCVGCQHGEYKSKSGNHNCKKCGKNSSSSKSAGAECICTENFFRKRGHESNYSKDCSRPPDAPTKITVTSKSNYAVVKWVAPLHDGSAPLGSYNISCRNCPKDETAFPTSTFNTRINITGLKSVASYQLSISNINKISNLIDEANWKVAHFSFTTLAGGKPGLIRDLDHEVNSDYSITLKWNPPFNKGGKDLRYIVTYGKQRKTTRNTTFVIQPGTEDKTYTVEIYAEAMVNDVLVDGDVFVYAKKIFVKGGIPLTLTIAVAASAIVFVILVLLGGFYIWKKRHPPYLQVVRMENGAVQLPSKFFSHAKLYVDPTTYNAVDEAVQEFAKEIDRKDLIAGELLGGGEFAEVFKGTLYKNGMMKDVAIKTLKSGGITKRDRDDFFGEAAILGQFSDCPNVVKLEGVILKDRPNLIILEYMRNGALDSYLQKNDNQFDVTQLLGMARCVANGMTYLSEIGFIHRDLAARNILVDEFNVCKVSDFGMSREIKIDDTYDTQGGKIPVRWTAPEAIQYKKFTSASDIWSYGILLWEIMSFGERPYWDWGNYQVLERLNAGYRLPPPMNCPKMIHDLMLKCWHKDRTKRPKFKEIGDQIEQWIRTPLLLREVASVVRKRDENLDYTVLETINKWLEAIGMDRYTENFLDNGYSTPRQVLNLTMEDLEKLKIVPIGHKKKIFKAIQNTKDQVDARHNSLNGKAAKKYSLSKGKK